jgi:hypothetical protein
VVSQFQTRTDSEHGGETRTKESKREQSGRPEDRGIEDIGSVSGEIKRQTMGRGLLEVHLVDAKGLGGTDFLGESVELPPRMFLVWLRFAPFLWQEIHRSGVYLQGR